MFLSKIWFIIVALVAGVALTFALIAPRPAVQKLGVLEGQRLDRAQYAAEQMFKVDAHKWIDRVSKLGRDAIVSDSLDAASRGTGEWTVLHKTLQDRFRALIPDLATGGIETLVAMDGKGRVVARVGDNDKEYGDYIGGAEVIADALRGYMSDDVWGTGGKLRARRGGARALEEPRPHRGRDLRGRRDGRRTSSSASRRTSTSTSRSCCAARSSRRRATWPASRCCPDLVEKHAAEIEKVKRTPAIPLTAGHDSLLAVAAPFPGQAGQQQAYYVLLGMQPAKSDLPSLLSHTSSDDLKWGNFPWIPLLAAVFVMIVVGLFTQRHEVEGPLESLRKDLQQLARGEITKIHDSRYGGKFGGLARDVNAAMERYTHAPAAPSEMAGKDLNAILGGKPAAAAAPSTCRARTPRSTATTPRRPSAPPRGRLRAAAPAVLRAAPRPRLRRRRARSSAASRAAAAWAAAAAAASRA